MDKTSDKRKCWSIRIFQISLLLFIAAFVIWSRNSRSLPYIYNDEFGYWMTPAYLEGLPWQSVCESIPYYSFGYGFVLWIIMRICPSSAVAYDISIYLNILWLILIYLLMKYILKNVFHIRHDLLIVTIAGVSTLFPGVLAESGYSWPECFLGFLFLFQLWLFYKACSSQNELYLSILGLVSAFSYFVHQRTLGILLAVSLVVILMSVFKKISKKGVILYIISVCVILYLGLSFKKSLIADMWESSATVAGNNMEGQVSKVFSLFSVDGLVDFILSISGKIFYIFAATFCLAPFAFFRMAKKLLNIIKLKGDFSILDWFTLVLLLATVFSLFINTVSMLIPYNITQVYYGRYIDNLLTIWIAIGFFEIYNEPPHLKEVVWFLIVYIGLAIDVKLQTKFYGLRWQAAINSAATAYLAEKEYFEAKKAMIIPSLMWLILSRKYKNPKNAILVPSIVMALMYTAISYSTIVKFNLDWINASLENQEIANVLKQSTDEEGFRVFAYYDEDGTFPQRFSGNGIQFLLSNCPVEMLYDINDLPKDDNWYLLVSSQEWKESDLDISFTSDYDTVYSSYLYTLLKKTS